MIIGRTFTFDAAHYLPDYEGKCKNMHGHTWHITVEVEGPIQDKGSSKGMVFDLSKLKEVVNYVLDKWDHKVLNTFLDPPTCENVAEFLGKKVDEGLPTQVRIHSVKVQEGEGGYALWLRS